MPNVELLVTKVTRFLRTPRYPSVIEQAITVAPTVSSTSDLDSLLRCCKLVRWTHCTCLLCLVFATSASARRLMLGYFTVRSLSCTNPIYPVFKEQLTSIFYHTNKRFVYRQPKIHPMSKDGYVLHGCSFRKIINRY